MYALLDNLGFEYDEHRLYRYRFDEGLTYLGNFPDIFSHTLLAAGNKLFAFYTRNYYELTGNPYDQMPLINLPSSKAAEFILASNGYLYAISGHEGIYRSTAPLGLPTAVTDVEKVMPLALYPNPVHEELRIRLDEAMMKEVDSYEIVDQLGAVVRQGTGIRGSVISVGGLLEGIYSLLLKADGRIVGVGRFVKG